MFALCALLNPVDGRFIHVHECERVIVAAVGGVYLHHAGVSPGAPGEFEILADAAAEGQRGECGLFDQHFFGGGKAVGGFDGVEVSAERSDGVVVAFCCIRVGSIRNGVAGWCE